jgi:hypothetical protein
MKGYTKLVELLGEIGVTHHHCGEAKNNLNKQVSIEISDEQDSGQGVILYFDVNEIGNEVFVCQE